MIGHIGRDKIFDKEVLDEVVGLMQQMVCRYLNFNIPHCNLRFYAPSYFVDELVCNYQDYDLKGIRVEDGQLYIWGTEVQPGYEHKIILFCPSLIPASQSPVIEISRFGLSNMAIVYRQ